LFLSVLENNQLVWQRIISSKEQFSSDAALVDGCEDSSPVVKQMYIGLIDLQKITSHGPYGDIVPGYVQRHRVDNQEEYITSIYYAYNGQAIKEDVGKHGLYILTNPMNLKLVWLPNKDGKIPKNAVQYTFTDDEALDVVYIGRTIDTKVIGRVQPSENCLYFPYFVKNIEKKTSEYEVLCIAQE
jgi:hypothetical protein